VDKAPSLGIPFFFRVVVPGAVVSGALTPMALKLLDGFRLSAEQQTLFVAGLLVFVGLLLSALDLPIYGFLEGRWWWPSRLKSWRVAYWRKKVQKLHARAKDLADPERAEHWYILRQYPRDSEGNPTATAPTTLGNILASYEGYPDARYGMDSVFYWPRIWLQLSKDTRTEIDESWALVDTMIYLVGGLILAGLAYLAAAGWSVLSSWFSWLPPLYNLEDLPRVVVAGLALIASAWIPYVISLPLHVRNGETFKAVFDLFRDKVAGLAPGTEEEKARFDEISNALQYGGAFTQRPKPPPLSIPPDAEFGVIFKKPV
jgi:hypothetical protein